MSIGRDIQIYNECGERLRNAQTFVDQHIKSAVIFASILYFLR